MPPSVARVPATAKASSLTTYGLPPSTRTRVSFSLVAAMTWPARDFSSQATIA